MVESLSAAQARRIALAAQGFGGRSPATAGRRRLARLVEDLGVLQIDSVNVFERSHYLPPFARLGGYDTAALDRLLLEPGGDFVEYWAHEAAFIPRSSWPLFRWRMRAYARRYASARGDWLSASGPVIDGIRAELAARGPSLVRELEPRRDRRREGWWDWSDTKRALEYLFATGEVVAAGRERFERRYALAPDVLGAELVDREVADDEAVYALTAVAARATGVGTLADLADYFRLPTAAAAEAVRRLEEEGSLAPVRVEGWVDGRGNPLPAWLHRDARVPRRLSAAALLSPFDPVVWFRPRAERLFGFRYRIEIYTPAHKRVHGYYVLPVLLGDRLVARVDLKNDRSARAVLVQSAWREPGAPEGPVAAATADLIERAAEWRGAADIVVADRGDLAAALGAELRTRRRS